MTTMAKKETVQRNWYVLDAAGKPLGRTAVTAAKLLRGKHKVDFTPNVDCGDFVIIVNVDKAVLTGKKLDNKHYYHHTGWIGNLKDVKYRTLMAERPEFAHGFRVVQHDFFDAENRHIRLFISLAAHAQVAAIVFPVVISEGRLVPRLVLQIEVKVRRCTQNTTVISLTEWQ